MKYAQFKVPGSTSGYHYIKDEEDAKYTTFIRVSEWVDVEFPQLPSEETVTAELAAINEQIRKTRIEHQQTINELETMRANLLSLTA
jgi:hypothetical protein